MLQIKNIYKDYKMGRDVTVHALRDVSLNFRTTDFVAILGPSGCGKTTMLNILGGLDKYTKGDLVINGTSTKDYTDRDWDSYRNHSIGFVFQSYNLIPHQTVLQNVELALALSGVGKRERRNRAKEALKKVGLADQARKRPNQLSGGQMQRVAIARAIVNSPDIVLADEPTGALDSETSLQVMEILKEISRDRLVVMVTHNPELAEQYATRTIRMLDGVVMSDSNPLTESEVQAELAKERQLNSTTNSTKKFKHGRSASIAVEKARQKARNKASKKPSLSFWTSFVLSLKNLLSKGGRTILTSFAGSIGIMGIALVFAVSQGMTNYIDAVQEDTLASYPLTIQQSHTDMGAMFSNFAGSAGSSVEQHEKDKVYEKLALYNLTKAVSKIETTQNNLSKYKQHLDSVLASGKGELYQALNGVHYSYNLDLQIYTQNTEDDRIMASDTGEIMMDVLSSLYGVDMSGMAATGGGMMSLLSQSSGNMSMWQELLPNKDGGLVNDVIKQQYDVIYGNWPTQANEVVLVVDKNNEIDDMTLYALGLKSKAEMDAIVDAVNKGQEPPEVEGKSWTYQQITELSYKTIFNFEFYKQFGDVWYDVRTEEHGLENLYHDDKVGLNLKVVGIIRPNPNASSNMLSGSICYTTALTKYVIEQAQQAPIVVAQKNNPNKDVLSGKYFQNNNMESEQKLQMVKDEIAAMTPNQQKMLCLQLISTPTAEQIATTTQQLQAIEDVNTLRGIVLQILTASGAANQMTTEYVNGLELEALQKMIPTLAPVYAQMQNLQQNMMKYTTEQCVAMLQGMLANPTDQVVDGIFQLVIDFSDTTYEDNLIHFGCLDIGSPSAVNLYAVSFADKDVIKEDISNYNAQQTDENKLQYVDYVGIIMSGVTTIIDAITYVLVGFVSISLIVSSIMIGVITLISVQERTKEIGILRAVGASKRNVSGMFNAETVIIGALSGLLGVGVTYLLCIPLNMILHALTGISNLSAYLPAPIAVVLVAISMLLTLVAGIIPSRSAAKKDPVVALRTE